MRLLILPALALFFPIIILWSLMQPIREVPLAWELAVVNADGDLPVDHPSVAEFREILDRLETRCSNSRREIVEVCIAAYYYRKERGSFDTLTELTQTIEGAIGSEIARAADIREIVRQMLPP